MSVDTSAEAAERLAIKAASESKLFSRKDYDDVAVLLRALAAERELMADKLRELAGDCANCNGKGVIVPDWGRDNPSAPACPDCADIRALAPPKA